MSRATAPHPAAATRAPAPVQVVVDDVHDLEQRVGDAARRAVACHRAVELVEPDVAEHDHAARAELIQRMDVALAAARRAAPGVQVRVGPHVRVPRPRGAP
ncbi:hypothetical protein GCM10011376_28260 [Nocardioides flavus (ex Wang et al. 2016)]|uniref:Uncharacterized protein n=1 Tax=Nocardioides flavus (ex Wang et al. 2016) TaxID=2058780 RepID=A0ABQ3HLU7_9ACTN|nr:hypothetical protein [Nocardioides flavus (ex Wang et al. 2016)]GHE18216.1 hypothetical protein GCM10011376_28260 [Nocardioides flavus (ex Wang et al. 2016)]